MERRRAEEAELKRKKEAQEKMQRQFQQQRLRHTQEEKDLFGQYATMRAKQMTEKRAPVAPEEVPVLGTLRNRASGRFEVREEKGSPRSPVKRVFSGKLSGFFDYVPESGSSKAFTKSNRRHVLQSVHSKRMSSHFDHIDSVRSAEHRGGSGDGEPRSPEAQ